MPRKKQPKPLPEHLESYLAGLEAQLLAGEVINRDKALQPVEQKLGRVIDIDAELQEHPEAAERFNLLWKRLQMRVADGAISRAADGGASATTILRGMGAMGGGGGSRGSGNGRLQLERMHRARVDKYRNGW